MKKNKPRTTIIPAVETAFTNSDKGELFGLKLQPWTPDRIIHAQSLGLQFPSLSKADWAQFVKTDVYPGAMRDAMIFACLSTTEADEVENVTYRDVKAFGIRHQIHNANGKPFWQAYARFMEVQKQIEASFTTPVGSKSDNEGDDPKD